MKIERHRYCKRLSIKSLCVGGARVRGASYDPNSGKLSTVSVCTGGLDESERFVVTLTADEYQALVTFVSANRRIDRR